MVKIGMKLGDRYEVLEKIGTGGMSDVYKAKDHKLNRLVAVKVLKQEFSENANFVSKFKVEAQAAAGLMHPNIVNVYDVGEENNINFIVMELVEGITLKNYIEKKARLSVKEAVTIAIQIGMGIEAAHNNHIIHRDIKPQNVIISKEGKVKVTDFGIAKAATSNTITSNVMGSVHYTSPEQARGGYSDEKSDVYSLGITLFEMLTGRVPFNGDTTVAIAIKQIQEEMPSPRDFVDDIPISVEQIVLKCTQKSSDRRYQSMGDLISDLKQSFLSPDVDFVRLSESDELGETRTLTDTELDSLKKSTKHTDDMITGTLPRIVEPDDDGEYDPKMEKITTILAIAVGVIICIIAIFLIGKTIGVFKMSKTDNVGTVSSVSVEKVEKVVVPDVLYMDKDKALAILKDNGLEGKVIYEESDTYDEGIVTEIASSVKVGLKADKGSEIVLKVSSGKTSVVVPDVIGFSLNAANETIMKAELKPDVLQEYSDTVPEGTIISQSPEGDLKAPKNSTVTITVSLGKAVDMVKVPNVLGKSVEEAVAELVEAGFTVNSVAEVYNEAYAEGFVCYQSLSSGSDAVKGSNIDLQSSMGKQAVYYRCNLSVNAPSTAEDENYESGTKTKIVLTGADGKELFSSETTSFPLAINLSNITSKSAMLTLTYEGKVPAVVEKDASGNDVVVKEATTETRSINREITFELQE